VECPYAGGRGIRNELRNKGHKVGRGRVRTLMRKMGVEPLYRKARLTKTHPGHTIYLYFLRRLTITEANVVWCSHITYIPMAKGFLLSRRHHGLGKQKGNVMASFEHIGHLVLHEGPGRAAFSLWRTANIQYGPGQPVYLGQL